MARLDNNQYVQEVLQHQWESWQAALSSAGTSGLTRFPCECGRLYLVEGKVIGKNVVNDPLRGDSLSGKGEATQKCPTCGSKERDARHALATDSPNIDLCPDKWHTASAPDRAEQLAREIIAIQMKCDAYKPPSPCPKCVEAVASLLRREMGRSSGEEGRDGK